MLASGFPLADMKKVRMIESTETPQIDAAMQRDMALGDTRRVNGTPSIFVMHHGQITPLPRGRRELFAAEAISRLLACSTSHGYRFMSSIDSSIALGPR